MTVIELMARLNGEVLGHKIRAVIGGEIVVVARMNGADWEYTPEGQTLADKHSNEVVAEVKAPRARKAKDAPVEPVAVESADIAPEL
jgi:hypothetical protein